MSETRGGQMEGLLLAGRYRLDYWIANGGMAAVWAGVDEVLDRRIAIKLMHQHLTLDEVFLHRFRREAIAAARLSHPGIVAVHDAVEDGPQLAIVMELIEGVTLKERVASNEAPLTIEESTDIAIAVADALEYAHRADLVHRDVKPANILLADDGRVLLTDFGIAKASASSDLTEGDVIGSVKYIAPERLDRSNDTDERSDVYSLGVVLYELLCGVAPFVSDDERSLALARLHRLPTAPGTVRPDIPAALDHIVMRALAIDPDDRWNGAAEFADALRGLIPTAIVAPVAAASDSRTAEEEELTVEDVAASEQLRRRIESALVTVVLLSATALGVSLIWSGEREGAEDPPPDTASPDDTISVVGDPEPRRPGEAFADITTFDPRGTGPAGEHDDEVGFAIDLQADTAWRTEGYRDRNFGSLKPGVGLVVELARPTSVRSVEVSSPDSGWSAEVFVAADRSSDLAGWGEAAASLRPDGDDPSQTRFDDREGRWVLVWFTDLGDGPAPVRLRVSEVSVNA